MASELVTRALRVLIGTHGEACKSGDRCTAIVAGRAALRELEAEQPASPGQECECRDVLATMPVVLEGWEELLQHLGLFKDAARVRAQLSMARKALSSPCPVQAEVARLRAELAGAREVLKPFGMALARLAEAEAWAKSRNTYTDHVITTRITKEDWERAAQWTADYPEGKA